jgi:putative nucleotidyltransferase with HDIG domain
MTVTNHKENLVRPDWPYFRLPPFSPVAIEVMQLVNQDSVSVEELSRLIASDQTFAGAVLTLANSALYSERAPIVDVLQAINRLGTRNIQGLCLNVAVVMFLGKSLRLPLMQNLWNHNLACGFIAEILATRTGLDPGNAFTCGLMHDIGRLALGVLQPKDYMLLLENFEGSPASILESEKEMFGFDHCEAGHELVQSWMLPAAFVEVVSTHHGKRQRNDPWDLAGLINVSCRIADAAGFTALPRCENTPYKDLTNELPRRAAKALYPDVESLALEIRGKIDLMLAI